MEHEPARKGDPHYGAREIKSAESPMMTGLREIPTAKERRKAVDAVLAKVKLNSTLR